MGAESRAEPREGGGGLEIRQATGASLHAPSPRSPRLPCRCLHWAAASWCSAHVWSWVPVPWSPVKWVLQGKRGPRTALPSVGRVLAGPQSSGCCSSGRCGAGPCPWPWVGSGLCGLQSLCQKRSLLNNQRTNNPLKMDKGVQHSNLLQPSCLPWIRHYHAQVPRVQQRGVLCWTGDIPGEGLALALPGAWEIWKDAYLGAGDQVEHEGRPCYAALPRPKGFGHGGAESHTFNESRVLETPLSSCLPGRCPPDWQQAFPTGTGLPCRTPSLNKPGSLGEKKMDKGSEHGSLWRRYTNDQ